MYIVRHMSHVYVNANNVSSLAYVCLGHLFLCKSHGTYVQTVNSESIG